LNQKGHKTKPSLLLRREVLLHEIIRATKATFEGSVDDSQAGMARHFGTEVNSKHTPAVNLLYKKIANSLAPIADDPPFSLRQLERHLYFSPRGRRRFSVRKPLVARRYPRRHARSRMAGRRPWEAFTLAQPLIALHS